MTVLVTGLMAQHPLLGGMTWHYLNYVLGLVELGHDVWYIEDSGEWPYKLDGGLTGDDFLPSSCDANVEYLGAVMSSHGLGDRWAYRCPIDGEWSGLSGESVRRLVRRADVVLNVSGSLARPEDYRAASRLVYIDTDPVFTQINLQRNDPGVTKAVLAHDVHFSFGELIASRFPDSCVKWRPTRQPVALEAWPAHPVDEARGAYTTIMNWSSYAPVEFEGASYGQKDVEFARFLSLPKESGMAFVVAMRGTSKGSLPGSDDDRSPAELSSVLEQAGWHVVDAVDACAGAARYQSFINGSRAEWSVAKQAYVRARSGWFSDRSACYLAAGRPVIVQDTGFSELLPVGEGLLCFNDFAEAVAALEAVEADLGRHAKAARALAAEYFDARRVLADLLDVATRTSS